MKCENCQSADATVHSLQLVSGKKTEQHLCQICADRQTIEVAPVSKILTEFVLRQSSNASGAQWQPRG